jgi:predicted RNase H-like HicB family nuclease
MLTYHASYWREEGTSLARVLDSPGVIAYGTSLDEARGAISAALVDMAETSLLRGETLPLPNPEASDEAAELVEPIHLVLTAGNRL